MVESIINSALPSTADAVIIAAPYDATSSFGKGADRAPQVIRDCLDNQVELYDRVSQGVPAARWTIAWENSGDVSALAPEEMVTQLAEVYSRYASAFRVIVGGEHSVTNAPLRVLAESAHETTVLQIDAHADLRPDDSDYNDAPHGRFAHCSVMRRAHELGYRIVQVGVRAYADFERELFNGEGITTWEWGPTPPSIGEIADSIRTENVYLTLDVDGIDPSVMPATGTPVPGGLDWYTTIELLRAVATRHRLVGADVVEVCPQSGNQVTEYAAAQLVYSLIGLALRDR